MKSWRTGRNFLSLLKADPEVTASLPSEELDKLFDYQYYLRYIDDIFHRLGLTESQWQEKINRSSELAPKRSRR
jgi:adenylosuccinate lyase